MDGNIKWFVFVPILDAIRLDRLNHDFVILTAVAGGMMIAASYSLVLEGIHFDHECTGNYRSTGKMYC